MAGIHKRGDSYKISVSMGFDDEGKRIFKTTTYIPKSTGKKAIEKEVRQFADEYEKRVKEGLYLEGDEIKFNAFVKLWADNWAVDHLTISTVEGYLDILKKRVQPHIGSIILAKIKPLHIENIYRSMKTNGNAPATIKRTHAVINSVFKYAYRMEIIKDNPCSRVQIPKAETDTSLHYFTLEQAKTFLKALEKEYTYKYKGHQRTDDTGKIYHVGEYEEKHSIPFQWRVFFNLSLFGGFRKSELVALTWEDIDYKHGTISINKAIAKVKGGQIVKETKTKAGNREIKLPDFCMQLLREWQNRQMMLCFNLGTQWKAERGKTAAKNNVFIQLDNGLPMHIDTPTHKFKEILQTYNDSCTNEADKLPLIRLHDLRHTSATLLLSRGTDIETVSNRLGHAKASVTLDIYGHALKEMDEAAANTLNSMFG